MEKLRIELRAVFYREGNYWVAHCLEMDVMGHGKRKSQAFAGMLEAIFVQIEKSISHNNHANIFQPADSRFFEMYSAGRDVANGVCTVETVQDRVSKLDDVTLQDVQTREYAGAYAMA